MNFTQQTCLECITLAVMMERFCKIKQIVEYLKLPKFFKQHDSAIFWFPDSCHLPLACLPAIRPSSTKFGGLKITQINWLLSLVYETAILRAIFLLHCGNSYILPLMTFFLYSLKDGNYLHTHSIPVKAYMHALIDACYFRL